MKLFSMFSGVGGIDKGFERAYGKELKIIGFCEWDKHASTVLKYRYPGVKNYGDATKIIPGELADFDILSAGFPCQAFSIAGKRKGFGDIRGTLFAEVVRVAAAKKPSLLLLENVAGLVSHDRGRTLATILEAFSELGYILQWEILNGKHWIPQNRERIFIVGYLGKERFRKILPLGENNGKTNELQGQSTNTIKARYEGNGEGSYIIESKQPTQEGVILQRSPEYVDGKRQVNVSETDTCPTLKAGCKKGDGEPLVCILNTGVKNEKTSRQVTYKESDYCQTLSGNSGDRNPLVSIRPCLTPDRLVKRQNGRRFKEDGEEMFSLTAQDKHCVLLQVGVIGKDSQATRVYDTDGLASTLKNGGGMGAKTGLYKVKPVQLGQSEQTFAFKAGTLIGKEGQEAFTLRSCNPNAVMVPEATKKGFAEAEPGDSINLENINSKTRRGRVGKGMAQTIDTNMQQHTLHADRIRRLTPTECERLMTWEDGWTKYGINEKGETIEISDSQRYKMCGNGVISAVVESIATAIKNAEEEK